MEMIEREVKSLLKVSLWLALSMTYARLASSNVPPGKVRLFTLFPVLCLLPTLPWSLSSIHLRGFFTFSLVWLALFKVLLLSFGLGPLSPSLPLLSFISTASLPIKLRTPNTKPSTSSTPSSSALLLFTSIAKAILLHIIISLYHYRHRIHPHLLFALYCAHTYLALELALTIIATLVGAFFRLDLEPQFDEPYRATSLHDFWSRRWNLLVSDILRPTIYVPVRAHCGPDAGTIAAFFVSGLMHEILIYYLTTVRPTGEAVSFFALQGLGMVLERRANRKGTWQQALHTMVATLLEVGFVAVTGFWLLFAPIMRSGIDERAVRECEMVLGILEEVGRTVVGCMLEITHKSDYL